MSGLCVLSIHVNNSVLCLYHTYTHTHIHLIAVHGLYDKRQECLASNNL